MLNFQVKTNLRNGEDKQITNNFINFIFYPNFTLNLTKKLQKYNKISCIKQFYKSIIIYFTLKTVIIKKSVFLRGYADFCQEVFSINFKVTSLFNFIIGLFHKLNFLFLIPFLIIVLFLFLILIAFQQSFTNIWIINTVINSVWITKMELEFVLFSFAFQDIISFHLFNVRVLDFFHVVNIIFYKIFIIIYPWII